jgi:hypothetical protein
VIKVQDKRIQTRAEEPIVPKTQEIKNKRWSRYKIQEYKHKQRNSQYTRHKRSKIKDDKDFPYKYAKRQTEEPIVHKTQEI